MKVLVRVMSLFGSAIWISFLVFASQFSGWSDGSGYYNSSADILWGMCPLIYFVICFGTSFAKRRGVPLLVWGIIGHIVLACFAVAGFVVLVPSLFYAIIWVAMYFSLEDAQAAQHKI
jgi:hypothetical protein